MATSRAQKKRISSYLELSSEIPTIKPQTLDVMLKNGLIRSGWGTNHIIKLAGKPIFVKKVPLTDLEFEHSFETSNIFGLPLYYNYGVGSAGFGAFRELLTHIKTTNWVLDGKTQNFPLMYHYRIIPRTERSARINRSKHQRYLKRWDDNRAIDHYIRERCKSKFELVLFLEHFPGTLAHWFKDNTHKVDSIYEHLHSTLDFLKDKGIIHFDAHLHNIVSDGESLYLSDFGLALDKHFNLSKKELDFFKQHQLYDFGQLIGSLGLELELAYRDLRAQKKKIIQSHFGPFDEDDWITRQEQFLSNLDFLKKLNVFNLNNKYMGFLKNNREVILLTNRFFSDLRNNPKKNAKFNGLKLKRLLTILRKI